MSWETKYPNFGILKIDGRKVKVYSDKNSYITIDASKDITNATWAGGELNLTLSDGRVRRYKDKNSYITI